LLTTLPGARSGCIAAYSATNRAAHTPHACKNNHHMAATCPPHQACSRCSKAKTGCLQGRASARKKAAGMVKKPEVWLIIMKATINWLSRCFASCRLVSKDCCGANKKETTYPSARLLSLPDAE